MLDAKRYIGNVGLIRKHTKWQCGVSLRRDKDGYAISNVISVNDASIQVRCALCCGKHNHGNYGPHGIALSHRHADCSNGTDKDSGYILKITKDTVDKRSDRDRIEDPIEGYYEEEK